MPVIAPFRIRLNDLQPYYYIQVKDSDDNVVDLTGATAVFSMRTVDGTLKINRASATIPAGTSGYAHYVWQSGDTDTSGTYYIEFEITPSSGGKFTLPAYDKAVVIIQDDLDAQ